MRDVTLNDTAIEMINRLREEVYLGEDSPLIPNEKGDFIKPINLLRRFYRLQTAAGIPEEELKPLVDAWRLANPNIVRLWWDLDRAASICVRERNTAECRGIKFIYQSGMMFIVLPSGRRLVYVKPKMGLNRYGNESVTFEGVGEQKKWLRLESYGPKFVENIVQATARDILAEAMLRLDAHGYKIVMHVHDEAVIEAPADTSLEDICEVMGQTPTWAKGLLLRADGYVCDFYKKD